MISRILYIFSVLIILTSCDYFTKENPRKVIARVNEHLLYKDEISKILPQNLSAEDSVNFTRSYIENWAKDKIVLDRSKFNLPIEEQQRYNEMVNKYKNELYKKAYMNALVSKKVGNSIDSFQINNYYENNKEIFKINEHLIKLRYLYLRNEMNEFDKIKESFKRFDLEDQIYLDNQKLKFDKVNLNDSMWQKSVDLFRNIKLSDKQKEKSILEKKKAYLEVEDTIGRFLIYVKDVLKPNSIAPESYIRPTIEQILKNKEELKLKAELEKQILEDAIKNNEYEKFE